MCNLGCKITKFPRYNKQKSVFFPLLTHFSCLGSVFAIRTHSFDDIFRLFHIEALGQLDNGNLVVFKAICLSAFHACEMDVVDMPTVAAAAYAVLLLTAAVVNLVQQVMLGKKPQRTEDARPVHVGHPLLHVAEGECLLLTRSLLPHQYSHCRGFHSMFCQMFFYSFHFRHYSFIIHHYVVTLSLAEKEPPPSSPRKSHRSRQFCCLARPHRIDHRHHHHPHIGNDSQPHISQAKSPKH